MYFYIHSVSTGPPGKMNVELTDQLRVSLGKCSAKGGASNLGGQFFLSIHQALDVCWVVPTALTGCDGTLEGGGWDLRGDAGGGAEGPTAQAGGQRVAQGFGDAVVQSLTQQQEVAGFLHLRTTTTNQQIQSSLRFVSTVLRLIVIKTEKPGSHRGGTGWLVLGGSCSSESSSEHLLPWATSCRSSSFSSSHWCSRMRLSPRGRQPAKFSSPRTYATDVSKTFLLLLCMPETRGNNSFFQKNSIPILPQNEWVIHIHGELRFDLKIHGILLVNNNSSPSPQSNSLNFF